MLAALCRLRCNAAALFSFLIYQHVKPDVGQDSTLIYHMFYIDSTTCSGWMLIGATAALILHFAKNNRR